MTTKTDEAEQVHRLRDILVEEVSLVDRAANKRKFLVVKRDGEEMLKPDGKGGFVEVEKTDEEKKDEAAAAEAKAKADADAKAKAEADAAAEAKAKEDAEKAKAADADSDDDKKPPFLDKDKQDAEAKAKAFDGVTDAFVSKALELAAEGSKLDVEKRGAAMSKDRFRRFKEAMSLLQTVFGELSPAPEAGVKGAKKSDEAPVTKSVTEDTALEKQVAALVGTVGELTKSVKANRSAVTTIAKSRGPGNQLPVEGAARKPVEKVHWDLDMTRPINKDTVEKGTYFD
jgi:membrane protein involved in colicin uptake